MFVDLHYITESLDQARETFLESFIHMHFPRCSSSNSHLKGVSPNVEEALQEQTCAIQCMESRSNFVLRPPDLVHKQDRTDTSITEPFISQDYIK